MFIIYSSSIFIFNQHHHTQTGLLSLQSRGGKVECAVFPTSDYYPAEFAYVLLVFNSVGTKGTSRGQSLNRIPHNALTSKNHLDFPACYVSSSLCCSCIDLFLSVCWGMCLRKFVVLPAITDSCEGLVVLLKSMFIFHDKNCLIWVDMLRTHVFEYQG